jgi:anaerobic magnesium-protoporphyrin IX monomethyl ester cyclase
MAQGDVPLFVDKLTWSQISELVLRWSFGAGKTSLLRKAPQALRHIRSFGDLRRYAVMGGIYLKLRLGRRKRDALRTSAPK